MSTSDRSNKDHERIFVGDKQIEITHFYAVDWDSKQPIRFAYGYWSHNGVFHQGFADYDGESFVTH